MSFRFAARTIIELGKELISSDAIALYELIKNAIDAGSDSGVSIKFVQSLRKEQYESLLLGLSQAETGTVDQLSAKIIDAIEADAPHKFTNEIKDRVMRAESLASLRKVVNYAYEDLSYIEIEDTGCGMSLSELNDVFLTIGTPYRRKKLDVALKNQDTSVPPSLGEKGIGRLSAMRLGDKLYVKTATRQDQFTNEIKIDWRDFEHEIDAMIEDIDVTPMRGVKKRDQTYHGTVLHISCLNTNWSKNKLNQIATMQLARITDPFWIKKRRFGIHLSYNGTRIHFTRYIRKILFKEAHAIVKGRYDVHSSVGEPTLQLSISVPLFNRRQETDLYGLTVLTQIAADRHGEVSPQTLSSLGSFTFDLFWFNRQRVKKPDGFETRKEFLDLISQWSGIMLYRDGYQVFPYGDEDTDWLELDRRALASPGYKLNKAQFVGRVNISRLANSALIDQTNREGLRDCEEKAALLHILRYAIQDQLRPTLDDCVRVEKGEKSDSDNPKLRRSEVARLTKRAKEKIRSVNAVRSEDRALLKEVLELFTELESRYHAAEKRLEESSEERERLIDLAGIGLIVEMLAHELTRTVEHSTEVLKRQPHDSLSLEVGEYFNTLRASMDSIKRRLRVIDPFSISARQRRRNFDLRRVLESVLASHEAQFERHDIHVVVLPKPCQSVSVHAAEGRIIQIIENLISNSVYWLRAQRKIRPLSRSEITIVINEGPPVNLRFTDSGPGIPVDRIDRVFKPFFSTKEEQTRQGLGLYIARECATYHGGSLTIDEQDLSERGTLRTFLLELPDTRNSS